MQNDYFLVAGIVIGGVGFLSLVNAFSVGRNLRTPLVLFVLSATFISMAALSEPGGYSLEEIPGIFVRVFRSFLN